MVEEKVLDFYRKGRIFEANSFHSISEEIVIEKLPVVGCCDDHKVPLMANVIHDYLLLRFKCIAKTRNIQICDAKKTDSHKQMKLSKLSSTANVFKENLVVDPAQSLTPEHTTRKRRAAGQESLVMESAENIGCEHIPRNKATSGKENVLPKEKVALNLSKKRVAETQDVIEPQHKKIKPVNTRKQTALQNITNVYQSKPKNVESCNEFLVKKETKTYSAKRTKINKIDTNAI